MPTLKQLTCHVEWAPTNIPFKEFGVSYSDGVVESYIAIPPEPTPFSISLRSSGFIAPGLAMFVFMDGVYQCNRNRDNLTATEDKGTGKAKSATEKGEKMGVSFRVRQKEEPRPDKKWVGRPWRFEPLQIIPAIPGMPDIGPKSHFDHLGEIVVVVLRCVPRNGRAATLSDGSRTPDSAMAPSLDPNDVEAAISDEEFELTKAHYKQLELESKKPSATEPDPVPEPETTPGVFDMLFDGASDRYDRPRRRRHGHHRDTDEPRRPTREHDNDYCAECDHIGHESETRPLNRPRTRPRTGSYTRLRGMPLLTTQSEADDDCSTCAEHQPDTTRYVVTQRSQKDHRHDRHAVRRPSQHERERTASYSLDSDRINHRGRSARRSRERRSHTDHHKVRERVRSPIPEMAKSDCDCSECNRVKRGRRSLERPPSRHGHHHKYHNNCNSPESEFEIHRHSHECYDVPKPASKSSGYREENVVINCPCSECNKPARHKKPDRQRSENNRDHDDHTDPIYAQDNQRENRPVHSPNETSPNSRILYGADTRNGVPSIILNVNQPSCSGEHSTCTACKDRSSRSDPVDNGCYVISNGRRIPHNCRRPRTQAPNNSHIWKGGHDNDDSRHNCRHCSSSHSHDHNRVRTCDRQSSGTHCGSHAGSHKHNCGNSQRCPSDPKSNNNGSNAGSRKHSGQQETAEQEWNKPASNQSCSCSMGNKKSQGDWNETNPTPQEWNGNDDRGSRSGAQGDWDKIDAGGDTGNNQGASDWPNEGSKPDWENSNGANQGDSSWANNDNNNGLNNSNWDSGNGNGDIQQPSDWDNSGNNGDGWQNDNQGNTGQEQQQDSWENNVRNDNNWETGNDANTNQNQWEQENQGGNANDGGNNAEANASNQESASAPIPPPQQPRWVPSQPYQFVTPTQQPAFASRIYYDPQNDEPPLYTVPEAVAQAESLSHQIQLGRAEEYIHKLRVPAYLDTMEQPYAKFVFKYRVQDVIEKKFDVKIEKDPEVVRRKLEMLPKSHIVDQLLHAQGFLGNQSYVSLVDQAKSEESRSEIQYGGSLLNTGNQAVHAYWPSSSELISPQVLPHTAILPGPGHGTLTSPTDLPSLDRFNIDGASANTNRVAFPPQGFYVYHPPYYSYSSEPPKAPKGTQSQYKPQSNAPHHERQGSTQSAGTKSGSSDGNSGVKSSSSQGSRQSSNQQSKPSNRRDNGDPFQKRQSSGSTGGSSQTREKSSRVSFQAEHSRDSARKTSGPPTGSGDPYQNKHSQNSDRKASDTRDPGDPFKNPHSGGGMRSSSGDTIRDTRSSRSGEGRGGDSFQVRHGRGHRDSSSQSSGNNVSGNSTRDQNGTHGRRSEPDWRQEAATEAVQW